jgi:ABC-type branched-subunit amino acid transport system substrate-binding protein
MAGPLPVPTPETAGRGFTATRILIGVATSSDSSDFGSTLGLDVVFGDQHAQIEALVRDLNSRGGILGRKVDVVFHDVDSADANSDPATAAQAACADWTQDHHVFAVVSAVTAINVEDLYRCLARTGTPVVVTDAASHPAAELNRHRPYVFAPGVMSIDRFVPVWIDRLEATGYFSAWNTAAGASGSAPVKIGMLTTESEDGETFARVVRQSLARHGRHVDVQVTGPTGTAGLSALSSAVLQFQSGHVTHVIANGAVVLLAPVAESQHYRPRYAISSWDAPAFTASTLASGGAEAQLHGARGAGYIPSADVEARQDPGDVSPAVGHCRQVMKRAGQDTSSRTTFLVMLINCEQLSFVDRALNAVGQLSDAALVRGSDLLGSTFPPLVTFKERFGPGRVDGAAVVRDLSYRTDCRCFAYDSRTDHHAA